MTKPLCLTLGRQSATIWHDNLAAAVRIQSTASSSLIQQFEDLYDQQQFDLSGVVILLQPELVFVHPTHPDFTQLNSQSLVYELESLFPVDVEDMLTTTPGKKSALVTVTSRRPIEPFLSFIHSKDGKVISICPESSLLIDSLSKGRTQDYRIVVQRANSSEHIQIVAHQLSSWTIKYDPDNSRSPIHPDSEESDFLVCLDGQSPPSNRPTSWKGTVIENGLGQLQKAVSSVARQKLIPSIDYLPSLSGSAQKANSSVLTTVFQILCILFAAVACALFLQSQRMSREIAFNDDQLQSFLTEAVPEQSASRMVKRTLQSAKSQLELQFPVAAQTQQSGWILNLLTTILNSMPTDYSIQIDNLELTSTNAVIFGSANDNSTLDLLCQQIMTRGLETEVQGNPTDFQVHIRVPATENDK